MTQIKADEQWLEAAATSVATKLQAFPAGLTPEEQVVFGHALRHLGTAAAGPTDDVAGYKVSLTALTEGRCYAQAKVYTWLWDTATLGLGSRPEFECTVTTQQA